MAIIYSYPIATPKSKDLLVGTSVFDENDPSSERTNPTVSFTVQSLINLIGPIIGTPNLQQVTGAGNTTTNSITIANSLSVNGSYIDSYGQSGSNGQVLTSQGTGTQTQWLASTGGVTSVGQSHEGDAFSVTGSPITSAGTLAIEMEGSALQYINGLGNLVLLSTLPQGAVTSLTTTGTSGASTLTSGVLNIPNYTNTQNTLTTTGTSGDATLVGEVLNIPNYTYTLPIATDTDLGGVKIGYTTDATARNYAVTLDTEQMLVNVPWTDTPPNPFQTITGIGTDNTDSGILLSNDGLTVKILGDGTVITATQTDNIITLTGVNTWIANSDTADGYVLKGENQDSKVWKTDASGVPGWRDDATIPDTGITSVVVNTGADETEPLAEDVTGRVLTLTSNVFGGGTKVGYVPVNTDGTQFLRGDGNWASIPTGLNYQGVWAASTTAEVATQSGTNLTIVTADASLIVGTIVEGTGISSTVKIDTVTDSSTFVLDTSVTVSVGTILTMSAPGGAPVLTGTGLQGDGILYICTVAGKAYPNNFRSTTPIATPGDWNVGDWCVFTGTAGTGEWTRIPATNAGVTSATTADGSFIEYSPVLSGSAGAITIGADLSAGGTASGTTFLRGDNQWAVPGGTGITSITGQEPITVVTTGTPTPTTPRIDLRYIDTGGETANDDNVVTVALDADTDTLHNDDTLIINDKVDSRAVPLYNTVKKFTLQSLKNFVGAGNITAVNTTLGLTGGGAGPGALTLSANYETDVNIVKASNFNNSSPTTITGGSTSQTQITISAAAAENIKVGMIAGTSALSNNIGTVSVNDLTGLITFDANLGVIVGTGDTVYFSSVLTNASELMFSTGANTDIFVTTLPLSRIDLGLFNNDQGWTNNAGTLTGIDNGLGIKIDDGSTATPEVNVRYLNITGANNIIVASPYDMGTDDPHGNDLLLLNDETDGKAKKLSLTTLSGYLAIGDITAVTAGNGLSGGGTSGDVTLNVEYDTDGNVILESFSGDFVAVTTVGGATTQTQLQFSAANIAKIKPGMVAGTTALGTEIGTVSSSTGTTVTFTANLGVTIGTGDNVNFSSVITSSSQLMFNAGTGASISEFVSHKALSTVDLGLFNNDQGWNTAAGTLTGVIGAEPLYSVTTGTGTPTVPEIKLRYNEATTGNNDSIITAAPAFGAGTADPSDLIIISDQSTGLNETKKIALSQLGFATASGDITAVAAGDGLTGGGTSGDVTVSVMYTGTNNVILDATASTDHESTSRMMLNYDNGGATAAVVNEMKLEDIQLGYFDNNLGWVVLGNTSTTALAGNTTTITTAQADEITANTAKTGITTTQAANIVTNNAKVTDSGIPAILSDGTLNRTAVLIRGDIGAGTVTSVAANTGLTGGTITSSGTLKVQYTGGTSVIMAAFANGVAFSDSDEFIRSTGSSGTASVERDTLGDLKTYIASGAPSGTVTSISALNTGVLVSASTTTPTVGVNYGAAGAGGTNLILGATDKTGVAPQGSDLILISDTVNSVLEYYELDDVPGFNKVGTVTSVAVTAGTGITASVATSTTTPNITITNSAPDTGTPAILSNGTVPTLNSGITAAEVRTLIGAGTSSTTGTVTSVGTAGTVSGLTLTGTVTSTGNLTLGGTLSLTSANVTDGLGYTPLQSETDTLADVTARGGASAGSTSIACSFTNTGAQTFGSGGSSDVYLGNAATNKFIRFHTNNINTYFDMNCGFVYWRQASSTRFEQNMTNGTFTASGDVVAFGSPSDKRLKENIKPIESALDKAMKLQGVTFDWKKSDSILSIKKDIGFIAQDVQKVAPELVRENEDGYLSMRHQGIAPILLEAIKELKQEIEELKLNKCNCNN